MSYHSAKYNWYQVTLEICPLTDCTLTAGYCSGLSLRMSCTLMGPLGLYLAKNNAK